MLTCHVTAISASVETFSYYYRTNTFWFFFLCVAIELGNIGDAQALGARLASSESNEVGQGEFVNEPSGRYYSFPTHPYNSLATDESVYFQKEKEEVEITVTKWVKKLSYFLRIFYKGPGDPHKHMYISLINFYLNNF